MHCRVVACLATMAVVLCCSAAAPAKQPWEDPFDHLEQLFRQSTSARETRPRVAKKQHLEPTDIEFDVDVFGGRETADGEPTLTQIPPGREDLEDDLESGLEAPNSSVFGPDRTPEEADARPQDTVTAKPADPILPGHHAPPPVIAKPVSRRGGYSQQPLTLGGILDDDEYEKRCREEEFCRHIWACAGGQNLRWHQRCLRDWHRDRMFRRGIGGGGRHIESSLPYPVELPGYPAVDATGGYFPMTGPTLPLGGGGYPASVTPQMGHPEFTVPHGRRLP